MVFACTLYDVTRNILIEDVDVTFIKVKYEIWD